MHRPALLLLDEPTGGLDPLMQQEVLELIREAKEAGTTGFFSSHVMSEVEAIAERVVIIRQGKIVEVAETAALTERSLVQATVHFQKPVNPDILADLTNVKMISQDGIFFLPGKLGAISNAHSKEDIKSMVIASENFLNSRN